MCLSLIDNEQKGNDAHGNNVVGRRKRSSGRRNANYFYNGNIVGMFARHGQVITNKLHILNAYFKMYNEYYIHHQSWFAIVRVSTVCG